MPDNGLHIEKGGLVTQEEILRFLQGQMDDAGRLRMEKAIADDPFLADAIEGLRDLDPAHAEVMLKKIFQDVDVITGVKKPFYLSASLKKYAAAAMIVVFIGLTFLITGKLRQSSQQSGEVAITSDSNSANIAMQHETTISAADSGSDMGNGSALIDSVADVKKPMNNNVTSSAFGNDIAMEKMEDVLSDADANTAPAVTKSLPSQTIFSNRYFSVESGEMHYDLSAGIESTSEVTTLSSLDIKKSDKLASKKRSDLDKAKNLDKTAAPAAVEDQAGSSETKDDMIINERLPQFPGGNDSLNMWLTRNLNLDLGPVQSGTLQLDFTVNMQGFISNPAVTSGIDTYTDNAVLQLLRAMPRWQPGLHEGTPVETHVQMPLEIRSLTPGEN